jgi:anti-sigma regulatory factor (Ser/Thr protein kinase)
MSTERWVFRAVPKAAAQAREATREVARRAGADPSSQSTIVMCVNEAVSNAITHAYRDRHEPGPVELEARQPNGALWFSVRDRGCGMAPRPDSPGAGLGLGLIAQLAGRLSIRPVAPSGTEVVMRFPVDEHRPEAH